MNRSLMLASRLAFSVVLSSSIVRFTEDMATYRALLDGTVVALGFLLDQRLNISGDLIN